MLVLADITVRRGPRVLFSHASLTINRGEKIGIVGPNGCGKSSLLALVNGELLPDSGELRLPDGLAIACVAQELDASPSSACDFVLDGDTELRAIERRIEQAQAMSDGVRLADLLAHYEALGGYEARAKAGRLLSGLGFGPVDAERPVAEFSGGWRVRLNVARALMSRSDLLLLDEPSNHLDLDAVLWLEQWLRGYRGTLLLVSHDREFLDRVIGRVLAIENGSLELYTGNYSAFEQQRAQRLASKTALYERQQREIAHISAFVERFRAKASKARQVQSRLRALERMRLIAPAHVDSPFEFGFGDPVKLPRPLLRLEAAAAGYCGRRMLEGVDIELSPGSRLGVLGRNGAGKSTFIKLLAGELAASAGRREAAADLSIGYFAQHQLEQLDAAESPIDLLRRAGGTERQAAPEQTLRDFLAGFGFRGERVFERCAPFSGGEKARLVLALICFRRPNLLLLDEPTNHLDLDMRDALALALQDFSGAVVLVSHDRHLLRTVADELWLVAENHVRPFDGDLDDYASWLAQDGRCSANTLPVEDTQSTDRQARRRNEAEARNRLSPLRAALTDCERRLDQLQVERSALEAELADPALYAPLGARRLREVLERRQVVVRQMDESERRWLEVAEQLEAAGRSAGPSR